MKKIKIGFFDSGLGGITVFKEAVKRIDAHYVYLGDNKNAPYGIKDKEKVKKYIYNCIDILVNKGCNIIVIACNTATSIAVKSLRERYKDICIIGTEPAIKVAADSKEFRRALICATSITVKEEKLSNLVNKLNIVDNVDMLALDELVKFIENGNYIDNVEIYVYLREKLKRYDLNKYSHVVLGCTHFPILKEYFENIFNKDTKIIDGSKGIVNNLERHILELDKNYFSKNVSSDVELCITKESKIFIDKFKDISGIEVDNVIVI